MCDTPCRLYLPTGYVPIAVDGEHVAKHSVDLTVPEGGAKFGLRAPHVSSFWFLGIPVVLGSAILGGTMLDDGLNGSVAKDGTYVPPNHAELVAGGVFLGLTAVAITAVTIVAVKARRGVAYRRAN